MTFDDFVSAILHGGFITLSIFILLLILSVCTWGIIISKILQLKREDKKNAAFVKAFNSAEDILEFCEVNKRRGMVDYDLGIVFEEVVNVQQKFEIQIQNFNRFFVRNVVRKQIQIWNLVLIFGRAQGYNFVAVQLFLFHDPIIIVKVIRRRPHSEF